MSFCQRAQATFGTQTPSSSLGGVALVEDCLEYIQQLRFYFSDVDERKDMFLFSLQFPNPISPLFNVPFGMERTAHNLFSSNNCSAGVLLIDLLFLLEQQGRWAHQGPLALQFPSTPALQFSYTPALPVQPLSPTTFAPRSSQIVTGCSPSSRECREAQESRKHKLYPLEEVREHPKCLECGGPGVIGVDNKHLFVSINEVGK